MEVQTESICEDYGIICVTRDGSNTRKLIFENDFLYEHRRNILLVDEWIQNDISSTKIRHMVAQGLSVKYLTPDVVVKYIGLNHLYGHA
jgi:nicotinamide mononucleotide adenylyltransferase